MSLSVSPSNAIGTQSNSSLSYTLTGQSDNSYKTTSIKLFEGASTNPEGDWNNAKWVWSSMGASNVSPISISNNSFSNSSVGGSLNFTLTPSDAGLTSKGSKTYTFFVLWQQTDYDYAQFTITYNPNIPIIYNGTQLTKIIFNGTTIDHLIYNDTQLY